MSSLVKVFVDADFRYISGLAHEPLTNPASANSCLFPVGLSADREAPRPTQRQDSRNSANQKAIVGGGAAPDPALPDPCSASRSSRFAVADANLDPCARLRPLASMVFGETSRPAGRLRSPKTVEARAPHRTGAVTRRGEASSRASGLTAPGRCGRRIGDRHRCKSRDSQPPHLREASRSARFLRTSTVRG